MSTESTQEHLETDRGSMQEPYLRIVKYTVLASWLVPFIVLAYNVGRKVLDVQTGVCSWTDLTFRLGWMLLGFAAMAILTRSCNRFGPAADRLATAQVDFLSGLPDRLVPAAILGSAALALLLELVVIRWQGTLFEIFAFYKNIGLLACFLGLGLGFALADGRQLPLFCVVPLLTWQMFFLVISRHGPAGWNAGILRAVPFTEQLHMGLDPARYYEYGCVVLFIVLVFLLTALTFVPVGQLCGRLLRQRPTLHAYGLNLLGSALGIGILFLLSMAWTPPSVWFALCFAGLLLFQAFESRLLALGTCLALLGLGILSWPVAVLQEQIYSPYQLIERGPGERGLTTIKAAGAYYQKIIDFSVQDERHPQAKEYVHYYAMPYRLAGSLERVAVVGAGTGNDVAMALRMGAGGVDAVEIDPAILAVGVQYHPQRPYQDRRVRAVVDDARTFFHTSEGRYDLIVYGLLDSHTLLSQGSSVRLDSYVYTVEALREAIGLLKPGGVLSLSFSVLSPEMGRKIFLMMQQAFDGVPPLCIRAGYDGAVIFLQRKGTPLEPPRDLLTDAGFADATSEYADPRLQADVSTDDWPFFYMPRRAYPLSYLLVTGLILLISFLLVRPFFQRQARRLQPAQAAFFLLGAGFMLIEVKGITELGLLFGNTWQVIGIVITGILVMAFLANLLVARWQVRSLLLPFLLLLASILLGLAIRSSVSYGPTLAGRLLAVALLTLPLFFSGIVFSSWLQRSENIAPAMAANLLGALCGGLLEYNAMYFGFAFLYGLAFVIYAGAFGCALIRRN